MNRYVMIFPVIIILLFMVPSIAFGQENAVSTLSDSVVDFDEFSDEIKKLEEPVIITQSNQMNDLVFDGKWTDNREWKQSAYNGWKFNDGHGIILRSAHQGNNVYFLVDFISDRTIDTNTDRAMICLESNNEKNLIAEKNAHCFIATMNNKNPITLQGGSISKIAGNFKKIIAENVTAIGTVSDFKDRYSAIPHSSYEFKIPTELVGRHNEYGLYVAVYDFHSNKLYSWPRNIELENNFTIPSPSKWGIMISPDKSLPEFEFPILLSILSITFIIFTARTKRSLFKMNLY